MIKDRLFNALCFLTRTDAALLRSSNRLDIQTTVADGIGLLLVVVLQIVIWTAAFSTFLPIAVALPLALLMSSIILVIEGAFAAYDWHLRGILAQTLETREWVMRVLTVAFRFGIALTLAFFTSIGAMMVMYDDSITNEMAAMRAKANVPVEEKYAQRIAAVDARLLKPLEANLEIARADLARQEARIATLRTDAAVVRREADLAFLEYERQAEGSNADGINRLEGRGPLYRDAKRLHGIATRNLVLAEDDLAFAQERKAVLEDALATLTAQQRAAVQHVESKRAELNAQMMRDPHYTPESDDPILRLVALDRIRKDPQNGPAMRSFYHATMALLIVMETAFFIMRMMFAPASVYMAKLIARTRLEALEVNVEHEAQVAALQARRGQIAASALADVAESADRCDPEKRQKTLRLLPG